MRLFDPWKLLSVGVLLLISALALSGASSRDGAAVKDVALISDGYTLEARITTSGNAKYTYFELSSPHRLVVDFHGTRNEIGFQERQIESASLKRVRTSLFNEGEREATRIVFDLETDTRSPLAPAST